MSRKHVIVAAIYGLFALLIGFWLWVIFRSLMTKDWTALITVPIPLVVAYFALRAQRKR